MVDTIRDELAAALGACLAHGLDCGESIEHGYHGVSAPSATEKKAGSIEDAAPDALARHKAAKDAEPALIEALREYLDWHETNFVLPSGNFEDPDQQSLARNARNALARATGEKP